MNSESRNPGPLVDVPRDAARADLLSAGLAIGVNCSPPGLLGQRLQRVPLVSPPDESQYAAE